MEDNAPLQSKQVSVSSWPNIAVLAVATAVLSSFLFGYQTIVLDTCAQLIAVKLQWCNNDWQSDCGHASFNIGLVNSSVYLGAAIGAYLSGRSKVVSLGSRMQIVIADILFAAGGLCGAAAQDFQTLLVGRIVSGLGLGMCAIAAPLYIAEVSPRERRGIHCAMHGVGITVGILAASSFGLPQGAPPSGPSQTVEGLDAWYWRFLLGFQILPALVQAVLFLRVLPIDPPSFLVQRGRVEEARALLYKTYGIDSSSMGVFTVPNLQSQNLNLEMQITELIEASAQAEDAPDIRIHEAIRDNYLGFAVLLGFGLAAFQQLCGINALMSYSNQFFLEGGIPPSRTTMASTAMAIANVGASIFSSRVVDEWGRRKLLLVGSMSQAAAMGALSVCVCPVVASLFPPVVLGLITVVAFSLFVVTFSAGLGAITWLYLSEIYPMEIRGTALSACGIINWLCSFAIVFVVKFLTLQQTCLLLFCISAAGSVGVYLWIVETKGCSMENSPLTPRSGRSSSTCLNTPRSPQVEYEELRD
jgi:sugar porter (SP) family MFS transporter